MQLPISRFCIEYHMIRNKTKQNFSREVQAVASAVGIRYITQIVFMSHNTEITHFETDFLFCPPECDQEKENFLKDNVLKNIKNKMDSIVISTPRIENAIEATKKLISDLCKINTSTVSKTEYDKLQRKYIRLEIQEKDIKHEFYKIFR